MVLSLVIQPQTCQYLLIPGITEAQQMGLFQILSAILHLGNVEVKERGSSSSGISVSRSVNAQINDFASFSKLLARLRNTQFQNEFPNDASGPFYT